jgi:hypothetical protein
MKARHIGRYVCNNYKMRIKQVLTGSQDIGSKDTCKAGCTDRQDRHAYKRRQEGYRDTQETQISTLHKQAGRK